MKHEVVCPDVYYRIHPARVGWIPIYIYTYWCELFILLYTGSPEPSDKECNGSRLFCALNN